MVSYANIKLPSKTLFFALLFKEELFNFTFNIYIDLKLAT